MCGKKPVDRPNWGTGSVDHDGEGGEPVDTPPLAADFIMTCSTVSRNITKLPHGKGPYSLLFSDRKSEQLVVDRNIPKVHMYLDLCDFAKADEGSPPYETPPPLWRAESGPRRLHLCPRLGRCSYDVSLPTACCERLRYGRVSHPNHRKQLLSACNSPATACLGNSRLGIFASDNVAFDGRLFQKRLRPEPGPNNGPSAVEGPLANLL